MVYMNKETGKLYLLTYWNTEERKFELEADFGWMKIVYNSRLTLKEAIALEYEDLGAL